ncbi:hypothetical protein P168DRAFT_177333 [Aspergillus campestris IBT 28561]|uniref:Uncharacterized protein n=1 Tax=Aspergillus campestris (strain IBT 28561) TaxID=1392248 RepID=A0A2I1CZT6_ASPC2|nr:uncharacterized protein P168DRAFT_177333 [Aspergillus campestris IBT 28561]PKY03111.1 hypothetical protein P168DRAFT_177333 [Aspergillus campestris IBT 28561]
MCFVEIDEDGPCIRVTEFRPQPLRVSFPGAKHGHHHHCHHRHHKAHHHCHHRRGSSSSSSSSSNDNSSDSSKGSKSSSKSSSSSSSKTSQTNTTITDTTSQNTSLVCPPRHRHRRCSAPPVIVDWDSRHGHEHEKTRDLESNDRDYDYTIRRTYTRRTRESILPWRRGRVLEIDEPGHRYVEYMEVPAVEWIPPRVRPRGRVCSDGDEVEVQYIAGR